jgi:hypothetical protein
MAEADFEHDIRATMRRFLYGVSGDAAPLALLKSQLSVKPVLPLHTPYTGLK